MRFKVDFRIPPAPPPTPGTRLRLQAPAVTLRNRPVIPDQSVTAKSFSPSLGAEQAAFARPVSWPTNIGSVSLLFAGTGYLMPRNREFNRPERVVNRRIRERPRLLARLSYGFALTEVPVIGSRHLQDDGISFSLTYRMAT